MTQDSLVARAREAALKAYAPYSRFSVGAAVESVDGEVALGANMENACYRLGICAEIAALTAAAQSFGLERVARIVVAGGHVGPDGLLAGASPVTPCLGPRSRNRLRQWRWHADDRHPDLGIAAAGIRTGEP